VSNLNIGTPDWQRGVVSAQKLLATVAAGVASVTVAVPSNCENLVIAFSVPLPGGAPVVQGVDTGVKYPVIPLNIVIPQKGFNFLAVPVLSSQDASVTITFAGAPTSKWYVNSDSGSRIVVDELLSLTLGRNAYPAPDDGVQILGSDGTDSRILATDTSGQLKVLIEGTSGLADPLPVSFNEPISTIDLHSPLLYAGAQVMGAAMGPATGTLYVWSVLLDNETGTNALLGIVNGSGDLFVRAMLAANSSVSIPLFGVPIIAPCTFYTSAGVNVTFARMFYG